MGQELRTDDAAGILAVRLLQDALDSPAAARRKRAGELLLFEAGPLPESSFGALRRHRPDWVLFIDAADMGTPPGTVAWLDPQRTESVPAGTHAFPMSSWSEYLTSELGCRVDLLGIQWKTLDFDSPVSEEVKQALQEIQAVFLAHFAEN